MAAKFTPGTWVFSVSDKRREIRANSESLMCDEAYYPWTPSNHYDWHLIAAAPDLYKALEMALEYLPSYASNTALDALAKARGEQ